MVDIPTTPLEFVEHHQIFLCPKDQVKNVVKAIESWERYKEALETYKKENGI